MQITFFSIQAKYARSLEVRPIQVTPEAISGLHFAEKAVPFHEKETLYSCIEIQYCVYLLDDEAKGEGANGVTNSVSDEDVADVLHTEGAGDKTLK